MKLIVTELLAQVPASSEHTFGLVAGDQVGQFNSGEGWLLIRSSEAPWSPGEPLDQGGLMIEAELIRLVVPTEEGTAFEASTPRGVLSGTSIRGGAHSGRV